MSVELSLYTQNKDPEDNQNISIIKTKFSQGYWYQTNQQKQCIQRNLNNYQLSDNLPTPCYPNTINLAGTPVSRHQAKQ